MVLSRHFVTVRHLPFLMLLGGCSSDFYMGALMGAMLAYVTTFAAMMLLGTKPYNDD